jgi:hypothetical protein
VINKTGRIDIKSIKNTRRKKRSHQSSFSSNPNMRQYAKSKTATLRRQSTLNKERQVKRKRFVKYVVIVMFIFIIWLQRISGVAVEPSLKSTSLDIKIQQAHQDYFNQESRWYFSLNRDKYVEYIENKVDSFDVWSIKYNFLTKDITIQGKPRQGSLRWQSQGIQYLVDANGVIFSSEDNKTAKLPLVIDPKNVDTSKQRTVTYKRFVTFVNVLDETWKKNGFKPKNYSVSDDLKRVDCYFDDKPYSIYINTNEEPGFQVDDAKKVIDHLSKNNQQPTQYIDVRVSGKAFWK